MLSPDTRSISLLYGSIPPNPGAASNTATPSRNKLQRDEAYRALGESQQQLVEANLELQRMMTVDGLTGLNNRRRFDEYATTEWYRAIRDRTCLCPLSFRYSRPHSVLCGP